MWFHIWPHWLRPELGLCVAGNTAAWPHRYPGLPHNIVCMLAQLLSHVQLFETLCSLSGSSVRGILRQECWSRLPCPPPGDLPNLGIEPTSPWLLPCQADSLPPGNPLHMVAGSKSECAEWEKIGRGGQTETDTDRHTRTRKQANTERGREEREGERDKKDRETEGWGRERELGGSLSFLWKASWRISLSLPIH